MSDPLHPKGKRSAWSDAIDVLMFALDMFKKLRRNRHKDHWRSDAVTDAYLFDRMDDEVRELLDAMVGEGAQCVRDECADVGNFAMMIHSRWRR